MKNKVWFATILVVVAVGIAAAQVPGIFTTVNATVGYLINGAAPNGQAICGNGTAGVYSASCAISVQTANTATALVNTPTQCSGSTPYASGIQAGGDAICVAAPVVSGTLANVTASRAIGTTYTNSGSNAVYVSGFVVTTVGGDTSEVTCTVNGIQVWSNQANATVVNYNTGFTCMVPPGGTYAITTAGTTSFSLGSWTEFTF